MAWNQSPFEEMVRLVDEGQKKIVLIGGYGYSDIGDESQLTAALINLRKLVPNAQFLILSDNPEHSFKYHGVEADYSIRDCLITRSRTSGSEIGKYFWKFMRLLGLDIYLRGLILLFNARRLRKKKRLFFLDDEGKRLLANLSNADLLFNVGGGNINSVFHIDFLNKCFTYILCRTFGKPIILSGQTIGPFYRWFDKFLARFVLNRVDVITLREKLSMTVLKDIGVTKPIIKVTADDSTLLPPVNEKKVKEVITREKIIEHHPLVGLNMIELGVLSPIKRRKAKKLLAEIADYLVSKYDARMVFVPMQYKAGADDRVACLDVLKLMKRKDKASVLMHEYDDRTLKGIIGQMDFVIGLRYHFIVFAVNSGVPSIGIYLDDYYSIKVKGILELIGQKKYACDIAETSIDDLINLVEDAFSNNKMIRKKLEKRTKELGKLSLFSIKYAKKLLSQNYLITGSHLQP